MYIFEKAFSKYNSIIWASRPVIILILDLLDWLVLKLLLKWALTIILNKFDYKKEKLIF